MTNRYFAALALAASLLHLNVVRADVACGKHDHVSLPDHGTPHHATEHKSGSETVHIHDGGARGVAKDRPCETPVQPQCCQALATCSPVFGAETDLAIHRHMPSHDVAVAALTDIPLSLIATPDPPPPKA